MTLKVIQGLVGARASPSLAESIRAPGEQNPPQQNNQHTPTTVQAVQVAMQSAVVNEAVVTNLRSSVKSHLTREGKRLSADEAQKVAHEVADKILEDTPEAAAAHTGLDKVASSGSAKDHLAG